MTPSSLVHGSRKETKVIFSFDEVSIKLYTVCRERISGSDQFTMCSLSVIQFDRFCVNDINDKLLYLKHILHESKSTLYVQLNLFSYFSFKRFILKCYRYKVRYNQKTFQNLILIVDFPCTIVTHLCISLYKFSAKIKQRKISIAV